jgi:hypothetical protein
MSHKKQAERSIDQAELCRKASEHARQGVELAANLHAHALSTGAPEFGLADVAIMSAMFVLQDYNLSMCEKLIGIQRKW